MGLTTPLHKNLLSLKNTMRLWLYTTEEWVKNFDDFFMMIYNIIEERRKIFFKDVLRQKSSLIFSSEKNSLFSYLLSIERKKKSFRPKLPSHELSISVSENYTFILASKLLLCHLSVQPSREREKYILSFLNLEYYSDYPGIRIKTYPLVSTLQF